MKKKKDELSFSHKLNSNYSMFGWTSSTIDARRSEVFQSCFYYLFSILMCSSNCTCNTIFHKPKILVKWQKHNFGFFPDPVFFANSRNGYKLKICHL